MTEPEDGGRPEPEEVEVPAAAGCPGCGERRMDWLIVDESSDEVTCGTCGNRYEFPQGGAA